MFGTLDESDIDLLLKYQVVGRIGCHDDGLTYVVPIGYAYDGESVFMHTHEGMKVDLMRKNPEVCFQVEEIANMANWKSVIAWGRFEELTDVFQRNQALKLLTHRIFPLTVSKMVHTPEGQEVPYVDGIIFRIKLTKKTGRFENDHMRPKSVY